MLWPIRLRRDLPEGHLVGLEPAGGDWPPPPEVLAPLLPEERVHLDGLPVPRRASWAAGRLALRTAMADLGVSAGPLLVTDRGAPLLPETMSGSISHKPGLAVALLALRPAQERFHIGVDVEPMVRRSVDISRRVLTRRERKLVDDLPDDQRWREVLRRFSAKEALYKALDPLVRRFVGFEEAEIVTRPNGVLELALMLKQAEGPYTVTGTSRQEGSWLISSVRVSPE